MNKIPTAEEFLYQSKSLHDMWDNTRGKGEWDEKAIINSHIEFAKLHVEAALKAASEKATTINVYKTRWSGLTKESYIELGVDTPAILNAYPLTNIK